MGKTTTLSAVTGLFAVLFGFLYTRRYAVYEKLVLLKFSKFETSICFEYPDGRVLKVGQNSDTIPCLTNIILNSPNEFFERVFLYTGTIGLGEAYVAKIWDIPSDFMLGDLLSQIIWEANNLGTTRAEVLLSWLNPIAWRIWYQRVYLDAVHDRAFDAESISFHYDLGNDFYDKFLDSSLTYTSGIWANNSMDLHAAQRHKLDILIKKLKIVDKNGNPDPSLRILDVGSGWGYLASKLSNESNGANVTGITISREQLRLAKDKFENKAVEQDTGHVAPRYVYSDYRDIEGPFDRIISVEMIEAVHMTRLDEFMQHMFDILSENGRLVIQHITNADIFPGRMPINRRTACKYPSFIIKHIFPGGCILHADWVHQAAVKAGFVQEHKEYYGAMYSRTLRNWYQNLKRNAKLLDSKKYDEKIVRTFEFYLANSEAAFRNGIGDLMHQVFVKPEQNAYTRNDFNVGNFEKVLENVVNPNE